MKNNYQTKRVQSRPQGAGKGEFGVSPNRFQTLSPETDDYEVSFPSLSGSYQAKAQRSCSKLVEDALSIRENLRKLIRDESMDKDFVTLLRTESKSFTAELLRFDKDPDPFSPSKMASLEARIRSLKGLSPVKAEDRVGTTKEESSPGGPPFLKAEEPSVVNPPAYEGKGREGDVQEETYTVGKKVVTPPVYVSAKVKDEKYNFSDKVDPILVASSSGNVCMFDGGFEKGDEPSGTHSPNVEENVTPISARNVLDELSKQDLGLVDGYEGMILEVNEEAKDDVEAETLIHFQDNIKPEMLDLGSGLEGNLNPTQVSVKMPKTNSGLDTVSIDAPLNPVATRGSYASHSGAGEWPRAVNDGNEGKNGHEASKSWASIVAGDNYEKLDDGVKQMKPASHMRSNVLPLFWVNVVKREGHDLKPLSWMSSFYGGSLGSSPDDPCFFLGASLAE
ncbi:hypothetical protein U1Q18_040898 [Sarracenia purpurea var. burkii]